MILRKLILIMRIAGDFDRTNEFALRGASYFTYDFNDSVSLFNNSEVIWSAATHIFGMTSVSRRTSSVIWRRARPTVLTIIQTCCPALKRQTQSPVSVLFTP